MGQLLHAVPGLAVHTLLFFTLLLHTPVIAVGAEQGEPHLQTDGELQGVIFVTELFAGEIPDEGPLHYLELYNSSHRSIDLSALTIIAGSRTTETGTTLTIGPYRQIVLANRESRLVQPDLILPSLEVPAPSGDIELRKGATRIFRASYEGLDGIRALEMRRITEALGGEAAAEHFQSSVEMMGAGRYGSPGTPGSTIRIFTTRFAQESRSGWRLNGVPGQLVKGPTGSDIFTGGTSGQPGGRSASERGAGGPPQAIGMGLFWREETPGETEWLAEEVRRRVNDLLVELPDDAEEWLVLANPFESPLSLAGIEPVGGSFGRVGGQIWDPLDRTFRLLDPEAQLEPWQAVVVRRGDAEAIRFNPSASPERDPQIPAVTFILESADTRDGATKLLFHERASHGPDSLDMEKLWPHFSEDRHQPTSLLYFPGPGRHHPVLARESRPLPLEERIEIPLGHLSYQTEGEHTLEWEMSDIPENWDLSLTDRYLGRVIDMREEISYRFRSEPTLRQGPELQDVPALVPVTIGESPEQERFVITAGPAIFSQQEELDELFQRETDQPTSIELYQNYPNPFSNVTSIRFYLPVDLDVTVSIFNIVGQRVALLADEVMAGGEGHELFWNASELPSGLYIIRLESSEGILTRKMTLIR